MTSTRDRKRRRALFFVGILVVSVTAAVALRLHLRRPKAVVLPRGAKAGDMLLAPCQVEIGGSEYAADCGTLVVPEYRDDPSSRLIALPLQRIRSPALHPAEPILYLSGGPGTSNMGWMPRPWLLTKHDVVKVGYRGVDGTPRLDCPSFSAALHGHGNDLLSDESLDSIGRAATVCADRLRADRVDLRGYTISEVVEDMEAARSGLGYERVDLLSESYGTRVAQIYAYKHPNHLLRSAMNRVNPPGHFVSLPATIDRQIEHYAELCRKDAACSARTSDLAASIRRVNRSMPASWLGVPIDPGKVRVIAFALLFHRSTAPSVFDAYLAAEAGDASGLAAMSVAYDFTLPNMMVWGEFLAIGCSADYQPGRDYRRELAAPDSIMGSPLAELIWGGAAGHWPPLLMPAEYREAHTTDVETLLISGSVDFSTPAQFAEEELLPYLKNGRHVVLAEQGHTQDFWRFQPEAARRLLTSFLDTGKADASLYRYQAMDFRPAIRFPLVAKAVLAAGLLLITTAGLSVWWIVRRVRRR